MGRAMAEGLAEYGATVVISSRKLDACQEAADAINSKNGGKAVAMACNVSKKADIEQLVEAARREVGPIDILAGNAGVNMHMGPMSSVSDDLYDKIMQTNVRSNHWLAQLVAPDMVKKGKGSIMLTSSINAFEGSKVLGTYGISKLAVIGLIRNLALEFGASGVRCNAICPGLIKTDFSEKLWSDPALVAPHLAATALGRLGDPDDFKGPAVFLASDASLYVTGQALTVCGGSHMWS
eukprot:CAMPEP_0198660022 /NCGR_PEP_ID=MMETSP1467-20131203/34688_1 /TAXON_ID=1462469 /ORGANISM="unid. sp., Strain CCMP2135" /LENGTH=236 /DNA_ID=CAMNT_0044396407 /DNA_START=1 /DNA_END=711 /DNA_ORIENTATION=+